MALHEALNQAMNAHDAETAASFFAEDAVWHYTPLPTLLNGREEIEAFLSSLFQAFPDVHIEQRRILLSGNTLVAECTATATHLGDWMGIPPTGESTSAVLSFRFNPHPGSPWSRVFPIRGKSKPSALPRSLSAKSSIPTLTYPPLSILAQVWPLWK